MSKQQAIKKDSGRKNEFYAQVDGSSMMRTVKENVVRTEFQENNDLERLKRIHQMKLNFCDKNKASNSKHMVQEEHPLIRKFKPVQVANVKAIAQSVLNGSFDLKGEDRHLK